MVNRQSSELSAPAAKERVLSNHKRTGSVLGHICESRLKIVFAARVQHLKPHPSAPTTLGKSLV